MAIPREAKRITYSSEIRALKVKSFSKEQRSIIQGALLGDGCLHTAWVGTSKNYRFAKTHSVKQREYVDWTYIKLKPFVLTPPWLYKPVQSLKVRTISHSELTKMRSIFYINGKKVLPSNIESIMNDTLALAVWFMDDGNIVKRNGKVTGYNLNTQSFSKQESETIIRLFKKLYDITFLLDKNKNAYRLAVWRKQSRETFRDLIKKHIIPSMQYKLG